MSASQHEHAAGQHEEMGTEHDSQYRPASRDTTDESGCDAYLGSCWASNPTEKHRDEANEHRAVAAKHRAASDALRRAETASCVGVSNFDRDVSPFAHREAILRVEALTRTQPAFYNSAIAEKQVGATVVLLPATGLTVERLQRVVTCHVARAASLGNDAPELSFCPLAVKGASATVRSAGDGFAIDVTADNPEGSAEILRRAQRLSTR